MKLADNDKVGHRKCILFFMIAMDKYKPALLDTSTVQTNLHYHMIQIVTAWFDLRNVNKYKVFEEEYIMIQDINACLI